MGGRNSKVFVSIILTLLIVGMLKSGSYVHPANAQGLPVLAGFETRITTDSADQYNPAISGNIIAYTDARGLDLDIWYHDLATHTDTHVPTGPGDQLFPDVSDGIIAYEDRQVGDVFAYSILTNVTTNISKSACGTDPDIGQGIVAWDDMSNGANSRIYAMNLTSGERRHITNSPGPWSDLFPAVNNGIIVWEHANNTEVDICSYDWASNTTRQITNTPTNEETPDVYGKNVVYERWNTAGTNCDIYLFNLTSSVERRLPFQHTTGWYSRDPHISGDFVSFENVSQLVSHVMLWNIATNQVYQISHGPSSQYLNDIDGNRIVYTDDRNTQLDVYMFTFVANYSLTILNTVG
jgi:beta propeller repeat protein